MRLLMDTKILRRPTPLTHLLSLFVLLPNVFPAMNRQSSFPTLRSSEIIYEVSKNRTIYAAFEDRGNAVSPHLHVASL